jgi:hypothetical protein
MSNLPSTPSTPTQNTKENRLSKALKRLSLKRTSGGSVRGDNKTPRDSPLKLVEYVAYYQVWENGIKKSEKEVSPHDDAPSLDAPVEVALECGYENVSGSAAN